MPDNNNILLDGIGLSGYRSFGEDIQYLGPFNKINFFIGQNNSGKSNILLFLAKHYPSIVNSINSNGAGDLSFSDLDTNKGNPDIDINFSFGSSISGYTFEKLFESFNDKGATKSRTLSILQSKTLCPQETLAWFDYTYDDLNKKWNYDQTVFQRLLKERIMPPHAWSELWAHLTNRSEGGGDLEVHWIPGVVEKLNPSSFLPTKVTLIPAIRKIGDAGSSLKGYGGEGIIERLAELQHPSHDDQEKRKQFEDINNFLQNVIDDSDAKLEIPNNKDTINVHANNKVLPISSLGTGIHEVVILAAAATVLTDQIICIEEPELHLHPLLQQKLIRYLIDHTNNQYFITTHSAHFLNTPESAIFHVKLEDGNTTVDLVMTDTEKSVICSDLGYRASDLLQANCIIWVEGPSDRIYLNHWISDSAPDLVEGIHYSIMFYGGKLLSHLTVEDNEEVDKFISLRRLNRNVLVLMDSDRTLPRGHINQTKKRVKEEFDKEPGFAWITKGREIENYISKETLLQAIKSIGHENTKLKKYDPYENLLKYRTGNKCLDKMKVAHAVTNHPAELDVLDLKKQMSKLISFIHKSNGSEND